MSLPFRTSTRVSEEILSMISRRLERGRLAVILSPVLHRVDSRTTIPLHLRHYPRRSCAVPCLKNIFKMIEPLYNQVRLPIYIIDSLTLPNLKRSLSLRRSCRSDYHHKTRVHLSVSRQPIYHTRRHRRLHRPTRHPLLLSRYPQQPTCLST